jgi:hypothetical protein
MNGVITNGVITQYSRMSQHTIFGQPTGASFSIPTDEDFTNGSWSIYDLALSEIGVNETDKRVFIRIDDEIKEFQLGSSITDDKLDYMILLMEQNRKCCENNTMLFYQQQSIIKELYYRQQIMLNNILNQLKKCCYKPIEVGCCRPFYVGQVVKDFSIDITPKQRPIYLNEVVNSVVQQAHGVIKQKELPIENVYSPVFDKNAFSIMGAPGSWTIVNNDVVSGGVSLKKYIPIKLGIKNGDKILECITCYRVITGGGLYPKKEAILVYQILNTKTGTRNTFEAGPNHFRSWFR